LQGRYDDVTPLIQQKSFWVTLDVAMHGAAYGRPCVAPTRVTQKDFCCFSGVISSYRPYNEF